MEDWSDGAMEYWSIGVLEYWSIEMAIGIRFNCQPVDGLIAFCNS
jgi:hypothetical protein